MVRRSAKIALEVVAIAVGGVAMGIAVLVWQLSSGPLSLAALNPAIERSLNKGLDTASVRITDTTLEWSPESRDLRLLITGVDVTDREGGGAVQVPEIELNLSGAALLRGIVAPTHIEASGIQATLLRREDGGIQVGFGAPDEEEPVDETGQDIFDNLLAALLGDQDPTDPAGYLEHFAVTGSEVTYYDRPTESTWRVAGATLRLERGAQGLVVAINGDVELDRQDWPVALRAEAVRGRDLVEITGDFGNVRLTNLARQAGVLRFLDKFDVPASGRVWGAMHRDGTPVAFSVDLEAGAGTVSLPRIGSDDTRDYDLESATVSAAFDAANRMININRLEYLAAGNQATLSGFVGADLFAAGGPHWLDTDIIARDVAVDLPELFDDRLLLDEVRFLGAIDLAKEALDITDLAVLAGETTIAASGRIEQADTAPLVYIDGTITDLPVGRLKTIWPKGAAKGAREWVFENIEDGKIGSGTIRVAAGPGEFAVEPIADEAIDVAFDFSGLTVRYLKGLPLMRDVTGTAQLRGNHFDLWVDTAWLDTEGVQKVSVSDGHFAAGDFHIKGSDGFIDGTFAGPTASILYVLDQEPLGYPSEFGVDPQAVGGSGEVKLELSLPLKKDVQFSDVAFGAAARVQRFALANLFDDVGITDGDLILQIGREGLEATGDIALNSVPFDATWQEDFERSGTYSTRYTLAGNVTERDLLALGIDVTSLIRGDVTGRVAAFGQGGDIKRADVSVDLTDALVMQREIRWFKEPGVGAKADFKIDFRPGGIFAFRDLVATGDGIEVRGALEIAQGAGLTSADLPIVRLGETNDLSFTLRQSEAGERLIKVTGARFDGRAVVSDFLAGRDRVAERAIVMAAEEADARVGRVDRPGAETPAAPALPVAEEEDTPGFILDAAFDEVVGHNDVVLSNVTLYAFDDGRWLNEVHARGSFADAGRTEIDLVSEPGNHRKLTAASADAGELLRGLDLFDDMKGGTLTIEADIDDNKEDNPMKGELLVENFRIVEAPVLANIFTLGSLTGLRDTLNGEGIAFNKLSLPFSSARGTWRLDEGRMSGPALGLTMQGEADRDSGALNLGGTIVPAYTINTVLGNIPLLGDLLTSREGEGVFGLTYAVRGFAEDPAVVVNPLSMVAPGFIRRLFEIGGGPASVPDEEGGGDSPAPAPQPSGEPQGGTRGESQSAPQSATPPSATAPESDVGPAEDIPAANAG